MKPIHLSRSLGVANKVRAAINRMNKSSELQRYGSFRSFDNCREQGYVLTVYGGGMKTFRLAFAENRNSDDIVVYAYNDINFPSNLPTEAGWKDKSYFPYQKYDKAARYIIFRATKWLELCGKN